MFRHLNRIGLALLLAVAVACGGDDGGDNGDSDGGGEALTKQEVIEQGDQICAEADAEFEEISGLESDPFAGDGADEEFLAAVDEGIEVTERRLERFRDLEVPEEDRETFDRLIELQEESLDRIREFRAAVEEGDQERATELVEANNETAVEAEELASAYGFEECASLA